MPGRNPVDATVLRDATHDAVRVGTETYSFDVTWRESRTDIELELSGAPSDERSAELFSSVFERALRRHKRVVVVARAVKARS